NHLENIIHFHAKDVRTFHIHDSLDKTTARGMSPGKFPGIVRPLLDWKIKKIADEK
ncbi:MAG: ABC transporter ATP-binding protein, partial [Bacteroidetes bacterium]|nr:ABC transporter ATP-binding protein [Bacteroidota bacterium]